MNRDFICAVRKVKRAGVGPSCRRLLFSCDGRREILDWCESEMEISYSSFGKDCPKSGFYDYRNTFFYKFLPKVTGISIYQARHLDHLNKKSLLGKFDPWERLKKENWIEDVVYSEKSM